MNIKWNESMALGIDSIDEQHKKLVEMCNNAFEWSKNMTEDYDYFDDINKLLSEISDYTEYHFNYEEELLRKYNYEEFTQHSIEHKFFVKKLQKLEKKDVDDNQQKFIVELSQFLFDWLVHHIMETDKKYTALLKENKVS